MVRLCAKKVVWRKNKLYFYDFGCWCILQAYFKRYGYNFSVWFIFTLPVKACFASVIFLPLRAARSHWNCMNHQAHPLVLASLTVCCLFTLYAVPRRVAHFSFYLLPPEMVSSYAPQSKENSATWSQQNVPNCYNVVFISYRCGRFPVGGRVFLFACFVFFWEFGETAIGLWFFNQEEWFLLYCLYRFFVFEFDTVLK